MQLASIVHLTFHSYQIFFYVLHVLSHWCPRIELWLGQVVHFLQAIGYHMLFMTHMLPDNLLLLCCEALQRARALQMSKQIMTFHVSLIILPSASSSCQGSKLINLVVISAQADNWNWSLMVQSEGWMTFYLIACISEVVHNDGEGNEA